VSLIKRKINKFSKTKKKLFFYRSEDDLSDDNNNSGIANTRHMTHDDRLIPAMMLRRHLHELGKNKFYDLEHCIKKSFCFFL